GCPERPDVRKPAFLFHGHFSLRVMCRQPAASSGGGRLRLDHCHVYVDPAPDALGDDAEILEQLLAPGEARGIWAADLRLQLDVDAADAEPACVGAADVRGDMRDEVGQARVRLPNAVRQTGGEAIPDGGAEDGRSIGRPIGAHWRWFVKGNRRPG